MTAIDHPTDRRDQIMDAVREVIDADHAAARRNRLATANAAIEAHTANIAAFLEDYGIDPGHGVITGPCTDPAHALAWVSTAAGFSFEIVAGRPNPYTYDPERGCNARPTECWLLHPLTSERVYRIDYQSTWPNAARAIHAADERTIDIGEPEPDADHPADVLVSALRAFIESLAGPEHGGF